MTKQDQDNVGEALCAAAQGHPSFRGIGTRAANTNAVELTEQRIMLLGRDGLIGGASAICVSI